VAAKAAAALKKAGGGGGAKRTRSGSKDGGGGGRGGNKKAKTGKGGKSSSSTAALAAAAAGGGGGGSTTATADGEMMTRMLSTFTKLEQSRFEAFQRSCLNAATIQKWVATCLNDRFGLLPLPQNSSNSTQSSSPRNQLSERMMRPLRDLVSSVPSGQADDIVMVVSTLAKIYAQRLVSTAHKLKREQQQQQQQQQLAITAGTTTTTTGEGEENDDSNRAPVVSPETPSTTTEATASLQPDDVWKAWEQRTRSGQDPGFFFQHNPAVNTGSMNPSLSAAPAVVACGGGGATTAFDDHSARRLAAMAAQDAYDAQFGFRDGGDDSGGDDEDMEVEPEQEEQDAGEATPIEVEHDRSNAAANAAPMEVDTVVAS